jgi:hypothetical protein
MLEESLGAHDAKLPLQQFSMLLWKRLDFLQRLHGQPSPNTSIVTPIKQRSTRQAISTTSDHPLNQGGLQEFAQRSPSLKCTIFGAICVWSWANGDDGKNSDRLPR